ncbi:MAG TPA: glycosyltransferase family 4 protein, partial [Bacteroidales bacterium]|nr:glycosyltransferase family 4 protein [Bacteroidales bacterium]
GSEILNRIKDSRIPSFRFRIQNLSFLNPLLLLRLTFFLRKKRIHTIILGLPSDVKAVGLASKLAGVKNIIYRRGTALPVHNTLLNRFLFSKVITRVLANSGEIKKRFLENNPLLIEEDRINVIYNGVKVNGVNFQNKEVSQEVLIGNAGRLVEQKGQKFLIDLARELTNRCLNFRILIAGKGPLRKSLEEYATLNEVKEKISFLDFVENMDTFLEKIDIFVLPSLHEGSANILIEAMAKAKPIVAFNISSIPEIVMHGETGFLAEFGNVQQLTNYVCKLVEDIELRKKLGERAYQHISEKFDAKLQFEKLLTLLN